MKFVKLLKSRNLTRSERYNKNLDKIFEHSKNWDKLKEQILRENGVEETEIEELAKNTGLGADALGEKVREMGLWDELTNRSHKNKVFSSVKKKAADSENGIKIYLTNLGKYNEGELVGEWVTLPVDDFKPILDRIGINPEQGYEEWFITDYEAPFEIGEYENIEKLNELAKIIQSLGEVEKEVFITCYNDLGYDLNEATEIVENHEYWYLPAKDYTEFGINYTKEIGGVKELDESTIDHCFDYNKLGRDLAIDWDATDSGYFLITK